MLRRKLVLFRRIMVATAIGFFVVTLTGSSPLGSGHSHDIHNYDCQYGQCSKIKDDGKRCKNCAQQGSIYCWSHRR